MTGCYAKKSTDTVSLYRIVFFCIIFVSGITCLGCSKSVRITVEDEATYREAEKRYKNPNWEIRLKAVKKMSSVSSHKMKDDFLVSALEDTHPMVKIEALKGLMNSPSFRARRRIKHLAEYEKNDNVRWYALRVLSSFREAVAAPVFVKGLDSHDSIIREESIRGLLTIDDFTVKYVSIPYIIQALKDQNINVRIATLQTLQIKDKRIYTVLAGMLDDKNNHQYTILAPLLKALSGYRLDPFVRKRISTLLTHPNTQIRILSLRALKKDIELEKNEPEM